MGAGFSSWLWIVDLLVRLVREVIEKLGSMNGDEDQADQIAAVKRAASRVLDPDTSENTLEV